MINWPIIPMVYNDSFTYMEWLGKLTYIAENHEVRIDDCEKNIIDLWAKVNDHETRITTLEDWREEVVDPFIEYATDKLNDHELRIVALEDDVADLKDWREGTVDPFITAITDWKSGIVDPFISNITTWKDDVVDPHITSINSWKTNTVDPFITSTTQELARLDDNATAEASARRNADNTLDNKINTVNTTAVEALNKVNRINIELENIGTVRYFMATATIGSVSGNTNLSFTVPDEDWVTCDVRFLADGKEYRVTLVTGAIDTTVEVNGKSFFLNHDATTHEIMVTVVNTQWAAADIVRFDYILYKGALTQAAQDQADIEFFDAMDATGDGRLDARDASMTLSFYADASTGVIPSEYTGQAAWRYWANLKNTEAGSQIVNPDAFPDFNEDGRVNAIDASAILSYYAWAATTDTTGMTGPQALREYRTQREAGLTD